MGYEIMEAETWHPRLDRNKCFLMRKALTRSILCMVLSLQEIYAHVGSGGASEEPPRHFVLHDSESRLMPMEKQVCEER